MPVQSNHLGHVYYLFSYASAVYALEQLFSIQRRILNFLFLKIKVINQIRLRDLHLRAFIELESSYDQLRITEQSLFSCGITFSNIQLHGLNFCFNRFTCLYTILVKSIQQLFLLKSSVLCFYFAVHFSSHASEVFFFFNEIWSMISYKHAFCININLIFDRLFYLWFPLLLEIATVLRDKCQQQHEVP